MAARKKDSHIDPEVILSDHSPAVRELVEEIRQLIREVVPTATESGHAAWHSLNYHHPDVGYFCGIFPRKEGADLGFEFGILLHDPQQLLNQGGRQFRSIYLAPGGDIPHQALIGFLRAAIALPASRSVRMAMVRTVTKPGEYANP